MRRNAKFQYCYDLLYMLGRNDKMNLLNSSCLTNRERDILYYRFVEGLQIKESAERLGVETDAFIKAQAKAVNRLYFWLKNHSDISRLAEMVT